jgi:hypothetical protein
MVPGRRLLREILRVTGSAEKCTPAKRISYYHAHPRSASTAQGTLSLLDNAIPVALNPPALGSEQVADRAAPGKVTDLPRPPEENLARESERQLLIGAPWTNWLVDGQDALV